MASIVVRGLDESVKRQLAAQAHENGRSLEAEVREILIRAARRPHIGLALLQVGRELGGVDDLPWGDSQGIARALDFE